ncbi:hypothetical protein BDW71DRAFT_216885 [Aspergillus fruticulosus]
MNTGLELGEPFVLVILLILYANVTLEIKPHTYTSGRFGALCRKIIELCPETSHIKACQKIKGGFNRVFIFTLDSEKTIVARLLFWLVGPAKLTTNSEVAIVHYFRRIDAIYQTKEIVDLEFPAFGSIYFDNTLRSASKQPLGEGFWLTIGEYCNGLVDAGLSQISPIDTEPKRLIYHGSPEVYLALLKCTCPMLKQMAANTQIRNSATPLLFYPDLHMRNVFILDDNPSATTSIIDSSETCAKAFDLPSQFYTPKLTGSRRMNGFKVQCPYPIPMQEELKKHKKEYRLFEAAQNLRADLSSLLNTVSDGWVPPKIFDGMLQAVLTNADSDNQPVRDEITLRSIWPFDIDQRRLLKSEGLYMGSKLHFLVKNDCITATVPAAIASSLVLKIVE